MEVQLVGMESQPNFEDELRDVPTDLWVTRRHRGPGQGYRDSPARKDEDDM